MRASFIDFDGGRTRYYHEGEGGPTLLLVHGSGASADTWVRTIDPLAERFRIVAPDLMGHGFADYVEKPADETPQRFQLRHLEKFIDAVGLDDFAVAGSSFGGLISALLYFERPRQVEKLILIGSSSVFHPPEMRRNTLSGAFANQSPALTDPSVETIRKRNIGSNFDKNETFEEIILAQLTSFNLPGRFDTFKATTEGLRDSVDVEADQAHHRLEQIAVPTCVITGREDPRAKWEVVEEQAKRIPNCELHIWDACGHKPFVEHPQRFCEAVLAFAR